MKYYIVFLKEGVVIDISSYSEDEYGDYRHKLLALRAELEESPEYCSVYKGYDTIQSLTA